MSKETKFTKGYLSVFDETVVDSNDYVIVEFCGAITSAQEDEANAILFKTAPKLYAMLDTLIARGVELMSIDEMDDEEDAATVHSDFNDSVILARKLLAEARGE